MSRAKKAKPVAQEEHDIGDEIRRLQKTHALLIAVQFAANHDAEDLDVSDAIAAIIVLVEESLAGLDRLETAAGKEARHGSE